MPFSSSTKRTLKRQGRYECCELCGSKIPRLENNGLQAAHIISDSSGGLDKPENAVVLCHSCAEVFDRFLKAKIAKAFETSRSEHGTPYVTPPDWITGEGRRSKGDEI